MKIVAFHLLNDYSGSPKVLKQLVRGWLKNNIAVTVVTCADREGFLSNIREASYCYYKYKWDENRFIRLINLFFSQLMMVIKIWPQLKKEDIVYVNTVLPFGAGIMGKLKGCRVIYHIHETSVKPMILKKFLFGIVKLTSNEVVYVSKYLSGTEKITNAKKYVLHNAIEDDFMESVPVKPLKTRNTRNVLMIASLKVYKGINEFVKLANACPYYSFKLVVNASSEEVNLFFQRTNKPSNLTIFSTQTNTHPFYEWADVVLNLSRPDGWVETFGLTIIEAMAYHLPVIVPTVGGITELVEDGINGFLVDSRNNALLKLKLENILENPELYEQMKFQASLKVKSFREAKFISQSINLLYNQSEELIYQTKNPNLLS